MCGLWSEGHDILPGGYLPDNSTAAAVAATILWHVSKTTIALPMATSTKMRISYRHEYDGWHMARRECHS